MRFRVLLMLLALVNAIAVNAAQSITPAGDTVAVINGSEISRSELNAEKQRLLRRRGGNKFRTERTSPVPGDKEALNNLIDRQLLFQESARAGVDISPDAVDKEIAMLKGKYRTETEFAMALRQQGMGCERGLARQIRQNMAIEALINARFKTGNEVSEQEARAFYDDHINDYLQPVRIRLSHFLAAFMPQGGAQARIAARRKIAVALKRLEKGAIFSDLAVASDDKSSRNKKGDLGYFVPGQLGKELDSVAFNLEVGQVSRSVEDRFGCHLLLVTERREQSYSDFREVRDDINKRIRAERRAVLLKPLLKQLRDTATIQYRSSAGN